MVTNFYDKVVVKIKYKDVDGSGVLISDVEENHSYLISAWHCFEKQSYIDYRDIETFRQEENVLKKISLNIKDKIIIKHSDIIIFEMDYLEDIPQYQIICPEIKEKAVFVGFPNGLSGEECMTSRYIIRGEINDFPSDSIVSAKYCYAAHESRLHQNDRCKRFTLCLVLTVRFRSLAPWGKLFQLFI